MIGTLVKSKSSLKWIPFMVRHEIGVRSFGLIKKYKYYYVHPSIMDLPMDILDYKIGDQVYFYFAGDIHVKILGRQNNNLKLK